MTVRILKEIGGSRVLVTSPERFPQEFDERLWRIDAGSYADNALSAQVRRDGFVLGRLIARSSP